VALSASQLVDTLAGLSLFADLSRPQLEQVAHKMTEDSYPVGQRILRQGFTGTGFYVILDGEVAIRIDGEERARLQKGDFFGEMSILLGEPPVADVVTTRQLHVLHLGGPELERFLRDHPPVMYRMLKTIALRLYNLSRTRS
jgi:CRP-like cAMP-binding protein